MNSRKRFFCNGLLLTAVALAVRGVSMSFNAYVSRVIGAEGVGLYTLVMTVYSFAVTFATSGINLTVTRTVAKDVADNGGRGVRKIMRAAVLYALIFSTSASLVLFGFADYFSTTVLSDARTVTPLRILASSLIPIAMTSVFTGYFVGVKRVSHNAFGQVAGQVFKIAITLFLVGKYARVSIRAATCALCFGVSLCEIFSFLLSMLQYFFDRRKVGKCTDRRGRFHDIRAMALPLAVSAYIRSALLTVEHILIPRKLRQRGENTAQALSSYGILHGMALPVLVFPMSPLSSFSGLLVPEFSASAARSEHKRLVRIANEALNTTLVYASAVAVFMYLFSEDIGYVIYNSYEAGRYISLLSAVIPIMYLDHVTDSMLKGIGEHVYSMWVNIMDSVLSVVLVWILIPIMGISGYALVVVLMEVFNFTLSAMRLRKRIKFKISLTSSLVFPLLCAAIASFLCRRLFIFAGAGTSFWLFVIKLIFAVCVFLALYIPLSQKLGNRQQKKHAENF